LIYHQVRVNHSTNQWKFNNLTFKVNVINNSRSIWHTWRSYHKDCFVLIWTQSIFLIKSFNSKNKWKFQLFDLQYLDHLWVKIKVCLVHNESLHDIKIISVQYSLLRNIFSTVLKIYNDSDFYTNEFNVMKMYPHTQGPTYV
jgi:hypothetical protein